MQAKVEYPQHVQEIGARVIAKLNGELVEALQQIAQFAAMPASEQAAHPISGAEFRQRLLMIGNAARAAIKSADIRVSV